MKHINSETKIMRKKKSISLSEYRDTHVGCPHCGKQLYMEIHHTEDNYPYVCKDCDENFSVLKS